MIVEYSANLKTYSWSTIDSWILAIQKFIESRAYPPQSRIVLVGNNSFRYFATLMAIRAAGHIAVPLNARAPELYLQNIFSEVEPVLVFKEDEISTPMPKSVAVESLSSELQATGSKIGFVAKPPGDRVAYIIYTSGSTGVAKGVEVTERARRRVLLANTLNPSADSTTRTLIASPLSHILALNFMELLYVRRESVVLLPYFKPDLFLQAIETQSVTDLSMVPSMWSMVLHCPGVLGDRQFHAVRKVTFSSEPLRIELMAAAERSFPNAELENGYGITEAGPSLFGSHPAQRNRPPLSVGYPRAGLEYRLVDGQLEIKTPFLFNGYHRRPDLLSQCLTSDGFFKTRDLFSVDEHGFFYFQGRADDMIVSGGKNIFPAEIEAALRRSPDVASCAVIGLFDPLKSQKPYAFVVLNKFSNANELDIKKFLGDHLPPQYLPEQIWILEELPRNSNWKIDRQKLHILAKQKLIYKMLHPSPANALSESKR